MTSHLDFRLDGVDIEGELFHLNVKWYQRKGG